MRFQKTLPRYYDQDSHKEYLELHDHHTLWRIDANIDDETYGELVVDAADAFKEETGVELLFLGRSGRHVCVEDTPSNSKRYQYLRKSAIEQEEALIALINEFGRMK